MEILKQYGYTFWRLGELMQSLVSLSVMAQPTEVGLLFHRENHSRLIRELRERVSQHLPSIIECCDELQLALSHKYATRILGELASAKNDDLHHSLIELQNRIDDELSLVMFMHFPSNHVEMFTRANPFGDNVSSRFPSSAYDVEEAAKCFALNRNTACVFHLMRSLEVPLSLLARDAGIVTDANWNKTLNSFDGVLELLKKKMQTNSAMKPSGWKEQELFYSEASALLRNIKNAWRNEVMHMERKYTSEEAARIYVATSNFMKFLASRLSE